MQESTDHQSSFYSMDFDMSIQECFFQNQATQLCATSSCRYRPFVCSQQQCKCQRQHESCLLINSQSLTKKIKKKMIDSAEIIKELNQTIQKCIDWLSDWRDRMEMDLKYYGLTEKEKQYMVAISSNETQNITGSIVLDIFQSASKPSTVPQPDNAIQLIKQYWQQQESKFCSTFNNIKGILGDTTKNFSKFNVEKRLISSKIVVSEQQEKILFSFFPKRVKGFKLLYRASENHFSVREFYKKCTKIPHTLVLVLNQYDKKIGGYTPIQWKVSKYQQYLPDPSSTSFIFSITNSDKFTLIDPQRAIEISNNQNGPAFGERDLQIKDYANEEGDPSQARVNHCYFNPNYKKSKKQSELQFSGNQWCNFRTKEWEAFQVIFE